MAEDKKPDVKPEGAVEHLTISVQTTAGDKTLFKGRGSLP